MMARGWNMVPTKVLLNGWIIRLILAPHQIEEIKRINISISENVVPALLPPRGSTTSTKKAIQNQNTALARQ